MVLQTKNEVVFYPTFLFLDTISTMLGPLIYLYINAKFLNKKKLIKEDIKLFVVPFFQLCLISIPKLWSMVNSSFTFEHLRVGYENLFALTNIYSVIYLVITNKILRRLYKGKSHNNTSQAADIKWFLKLLNTMIIVISVDISITIFEVTYGDINQAVPIIAFLAIFFIIYLAYHGILKTNVLLPEFLLKKKELLMPKEITQAKHKSVVASKKTYQTEEMQELKEILETQMSNHQWYLNMEVSLSFLSQKLEVSDKKISYLLNQYMGVSFYDYINHLRVEEVKKRLKDPAYANYTILAIAMDCGFSSKTSFNRTFSRLTGMTPSKFKKNQELTSLVQK